MMPCSYVRLENGFTVIVTHAAPRRRRCRCGAVAAYQCDWKTGDGKTCDRWLCAGCRPHVGEDKDLCQEHQRAYKAWLAARTAPA